MSNVRTSDVGAIFVECIGLAMQVPLVVLGVWFISGDDVELLALWCLFGTLYLGAVITALNIAVRFPGTGGRGGTRRFLAHPVMRILAAALTFSSSLVGVLAAVELIVLRNDPEWSGFIELFAVWAMLVAWSLYHWGWARIYYARFHHHRSSNGPPLEFPRTPDPELLDFVYFSFTNATAFSVSDVLVTQTRMRWTVVWHTASSFFFNALIIVLAVNTITGIDVDPSMLQ